MVAGIGAGAIFPAGRFRVAGDGQPKPPARIATFDARDLRSFFESREPKTHLELSVRPPHSRDKKLKK